MKWQTDDGEEIILNNKAGNDLCMWDHSSTPEDERYKHLIGKRVKLPIEVAERDQYVEIATHPSVKMDFGSGIQWFALTVIRTTSRYSGNLG